MKRQYLGATNITRTDYWSGGKGSEELRRNETYLYALIDLSQEKIGILKNNTDVQNEYNKQDLCFLCLNAVELSQGNTDWLARYGVVIGNMITEGKIYRGYDNLEEENKALDELVSEAMIRVDKMNEKESNSEFSEWFKYHILQQNYYANFDGSITTDAPHVSGLGATSESDELTQRAKDTGFYFVYLLNDTEEVFSNAVDVQVLREKIAYQEEYLNYVERCGTNQTRDSVLVAAASGIIRDMGTDSYGALQILKGKQGVDGLGVLTEAAATIIVGIITAVISAATVLITKVIDKAGDKELAKSLLANSKLSDDQIAGNAPSPGEYGYETYVSLTEKKEKIEKKLKTYERFPDAAIIGVSISVWALIFGSAIYTSRRKK